LERGKGLWPQNTKKDLSFEIDGAGVDLTVHLRLQMPPAFNLGLISVFRKAREILRGKLFGGGALPGELLANEGVFRHRAAGESGHALLKRDLSWAGNQSGVEARKITVWVHPDKER